MNDVSEFVIDSLLTQQIHLTPIVFTYDLLERIIGEITNAANVPDLQAGPHRLPMWESGWQNTGVVNGIPAYFGKYLYLRVNQQLMQANAIPRDAEYASYRAVQSYVYQNYMVDCDYLYEFGCGLGRSLRLLNREFPHVTLVGLDWASSAVKVVADLGFQGELFDMFHPSNFSLQRESVVLTVAAMEQLGPKFGPFLEYLLHQRPKRVIHIEPINELLDPTNVLDVLSIVYAASRNYLRNYLSCLQSAEYGGRLRIIEAKRSYIGSFLLDGYSIVVWEPL